MEGNKSLDLTFLMYSQNVTHPKVLPHGALWISAFFGKKALCSLGCNFQNYLRKQICQSPRFGAIYPVALGDLKIFQTLQGPIGQWYLLSSLPVNPKQNHQRCSSPLYRLCLLLPIGWLLLLPYTKADLLNVNISEFMSAEIESKPFLFVCN